jgi:hypothetical protein
VRACFIISADNSPCRFEIPGQCAHAYAAYSDKVNVPYVFKVLHLLIDQFNDLPGYALVGILDS